MNSQFRYKKIYVCPRSPDPIYMVTDYIKWVRTSLTYSIDLSPLILREKKISVADCDFRNCNSVIKMHNIYSPEKTQVDPYVDV